jgi:hypothetical protein
VSAGGVRRQHHARSPITRLQPPIRCSPICHLRHQYCTEYCTCTVHTRFGRILRTSKQYARSNEDPPPPDREPASAGVVQYKLPLMMHRQYIMERNLHLLGHEWVSRNVNVAGGEKTEAAHGMITRTATGEGCLRHGSIRYPHQTTHYSTPYRITTVLYCTVQD